MMSTKNKISYIFSESLFVLLIFLFFSLLFNNLLNINLDFEMVVILSFAICGIYVFSRYVLSGIEFTNIYTKKEFKTEKRKIIFQTIRFTIIFGLLYLIFVEIPKSQSSWFAYILLLCLIAIFSFFMSYISLKKSYQKNKNLLD